MQVWYGLKPGTRIKIREDKVRRNGVVVQEYPHFVLVQLKNYKVSINKASVHCGEEAVGQRIGKGGTLREQERDI